jgi:gamma-glutamyltranspeptidase
MFDGRPASASVHGGLAVAVPGELKCLELAHARFGSLPWHQLVEPVAQRAAAGVPVTPYLARVLRDAADRYNGKNQQLPDYGLRRLLTRDDDWDGVLTERQTLWNPALAGLLRDVQQRGADALYGGDRPERLAEEIRSAGGGIVAADDLRSYRATLRTPVSVSASGLRWRGVPPPSSGGAAVLGAVQFLSGFAAPFAADAAALSQHRLVEAGKHAFAVRMSLSDPDYHADTVRAAVRDLTDPAYMALLRRDHYRDNATLPLSQYGGPKWAQLRDADGTNNATDAQEGDRRELLSRFGYLEDRGTSHFSIVDADGNAVAATTSINTVFGSAVVSPSTGIVFGNSTFF